MRVKILAAVLAFALLASGSCNLSERIVDLVKSSVTTTSFKYPIVTHELQSKWYSSDRDPIPSAQVAEVLNPLQELSKIFDSIQGVAKSNPFLAHRLAQICSIRFTKKVRILNIDNSVNGFKFAVKISAIVAERVSSSAYAMRGLEGTGIVTVNPPKDSWVAVRDNQLTLDHLEGMTFKNMLAKAQSSTGLKSMQPLLGATSKLNRHMLESALLQKYFSQVDYSMAENDDNDLTDISSFIYQASNTRIKDKAILTKISQLAASATQSNFLYAPTDKYLIYITVWKSPYFRAEVRSYTVQGGLPTLGFATSTGKWSVQTQGSASKVTMSNLIGLFKASI